MKDEKDKAVRSTGGGVSAGGKASAAGKVDAGHGSDLHDGRIQRIHWWIMSVLQLIVAIGLVAAIYEGHWQNAALIAGIILVTFIATIMDKRFGLHIPAEFELLVVAFIFASIFLGEVRNYYERFPWWDIALHTTSGFLLGLLGFLLVHVLNESDRVDLHMKPRFVALFACLFAISVGALWEIFEFTMDQVFGMNMQKPMLGDPSGLTDTMWDLIVDTIGAVLISVLGWWHLERKSRSFIETWIRKFIERNPQLFRKGAPPADEHDDYVL